MNIKNLIFISLIQLSPSFMYSRDIPYILSIKLPSHVSNMPSIYGCYKGNKLTFNNGITIFEEDHSVNNFILVVTDKIYYDKNREYLKRSPEGNCKIFYIEKKSNSCYKWTIKEENSKNLPTRLSPQSLIILAPSNHVTIDNNKTIKLNNNNLDKSNETNNDVCYMPEIIIDSNLTEKETTDKFNFIALNAIDVNNVHDKVCTQLKEHGKCIIAKNS